MAEDTRWLDAEEQHAWRAYLRATRLIEVALDKAVQEHGISLPEYEILVVLSESAGSELRMSEMADIVIQSRSRLTHTATRLERAGLVERRPCEDDRRGVVLALTAAGLARLEEIAAVHVTSVREIIVDNLTRAQFTALGDTMRQVARANGYDVDVLNPAGALVAEPA